MFKLRPSTADELDFLKTFLFVHGSNQWNYLPQDGIAAQFQRLADGEDLALVAVVEDVIVGLLIHSQPGAVPTSLAPYSPKQAVFVAEVVVHEAHQGQGIGTALLHAVIAWASEHGAPAVVIDRHDENAASAGMMRKAGFVAVASFDDSGRRTVGNKKTTVLIKECT